MAILPVSCVDFKGKSNIKFGHNDEHSREYATEPISANSSKAVPVMVLMALSPSLLNAAVPKTTEEMSDAPKVVMVEDLPEQEMTEATYVMSPELQGTRQSSAPFGWELFNSTHENIKFSMPAKGNGKNCHLVFTAPKTNSNEIYSVYVVRDGRPGSVRMGDRPPEVQTLVFHNLGNPNENFCSVITMESLLGPDRTEIGSMMSEIMLDDESAQKIIDLVSGDTKWKNKTHMQIKEVSDAVIHKSVTTIYK